MHALLFDLDGTLVDTVYAHVLAWQWALNEMGVVVDGYRLHRHVGSSGTLIVRYAQREAGRELSAEQVETVHRRHSLRPTIGRNPLSLRPTTGRKQIDQTRIVRRRIALRSNRHATIVRLLRPTIARTTIVPQRHRSAINRRRGRRHRNVP